MQVEEDTVAISHYYNGIDTLEIICDENGYYVNASRLCEKYNKEYEEWYNNTAAIATLTAKKGPIEEKYLSMSMVPSGEITFNYTNESKLFIEASGSSYSGIYIHNVLLPYLLPWLNSDYAVKYSGMMIGHQGDADTLIEKISPKFTQLSSDITKVWEIVDKILENTEPRQELELEPQPIENTQPKQQVLLIIDLGRCRSHRYRYRMYIYPLSEHMDKMDYIYDKYCGMYPITMVFNPDKVDLWDEITSDLGKYMTISGHRFNIDKSMSGNTFSRKIMQIYNDVIG